MSPPQTPRLCGWVRPRLPLLRGLSAALSPAEQSREALDCTWPCAPALLAPVSTGVVGRAFGAPWLHSGAALVAPRWGVPWKQEARVPSLGREHSLKEETAARASALAWAAVSPVTA